MIIYLIFVSLPITLHLVVYNPNPFLPASKSGYHPSYTSQKSGKNLMSKLVPTHNVLKEQKECCNS